MATFSKESTKRGDLLHSTVGRLGGWLYSMPAPALTLFHPHRHSRELTIKQGITDRTRYISVLWWSHW